MPTDDVAKLWKAVSLFLLLLVANTWIHTQGGQPIFDVKLIHTSRVGSALFCLIIGSVILSIAAILGRNYAQRIAGRWEQKIPLLWISAIEPGARLARWYQGTVLTFLVAVPAAGLAHFAGIVNAGTLCHRASQTPLLSASLWARLPASFKDTYRIGADEACKGGVTFVPFFEPLLIAALLISAVVLTLAHLHAVFRKPGATNAQQTARSATQY